MNSEEVNGVHIPQAMTAPTVVGPVIPWWEWAGVGFVGLLLGGTVAKMGVKGAVSGALLYLLGYWVRNRRPTGGYAIPFPGPAVALFGGERQGIPQSEAAPQQV